MPGPSVPGVPGPAGPLPLAASPLLPPVPLAALVAEVFGDRLPAVQRYADHLASSGVERGLVGPRETDRLWERHLLNCAALARLCPRGGSVLDVGSGAGLPGLVLALVRPDLRVTLVEPLLRRTRWLEEVVADLGVPVRVVQARAESCGAVAGTVTARAVAPLDRLLGLCLPLVAPGGQLLALKGRTAAEEVAAAEPGLRRSRVAAWEVLALEPAPSTEPSAPPSTALAESSGADGAAAPPVAPGRGGVTSTSLATTVVRVTVRAAR